MPSLFKDSDKERFLIYLTAYHTDISILAASCLCLILRDNGMRFMLHVPKGMRDRLPETLDDGKLQLFHPEDFNKFIISLQDPESKIKDVIWKRRGEQLDIILNADNNSTIDSDISIKKRVNQFDTILSFTISDEEVLFQELPAELQNCDKKIIAADPTYLQSLADLLSFDKLKINQSTAELLMNLLYLETEHMQSNLSVQIFAIAELLMQVEPPLEFLKREKGNIPQTKEISKEAGNAAIKNAAQSVDSANANKMEIDTANVNKPEVEPASGSKTEVESANINKTYTDPAIISKPDIDFTNQPVENIAVAKGPKSTGTRSDTTNTETDGEGHTPESVTDERNEQPEKPLDQAEPATPKEKKTNTKSVKSPSPGNHGSTLDKKVENLLQFRNSKGNNQPSSPSVYDPLAPAKEPPHPIFDDSETEPVSEYQGPLPPAKQVS